MALLKLSQNVLNLVMSPANLGNCNFGNLGLIPDLDSVLTSEACPGEDNELVKFRPVCSDNTGELGGLARS